MPPRRARRSLSRLSLSRGSRSGPRPGCSSGDVPDRVAAARPEAFLALDKPVRRRIGAAAGALAAARPAAAKMITGARGVLRVRVGGYRVLCTVGEGKLMVLVLGAGHRGEIYRR